jgi:uncharacterized protein (TIGR03437 family)
MLSRVAGLLALVAGSLAAQSTCPAVNFLTARTVNLKPSPTSHIDVVRQSDGSYTGYEVADAAPYRIIQTTPHFERQFAACIPHTIPASPSAVSPAPNPPGAGSQLQVSAAVGSNYFVARISADQVTLNFDVFDSQHSLVSETPFESLITPPGAAGQAIEHFQSLALADLNGDGKLDLIAVAVLDGPPAAGIEYGGVWTFLGNGDGTFQVGNRQVLTSRTFTVPAQSASIADLNGDGKPDLILTPPYSAPVNVFLGNGDGSFQTQPLPLTIPATCQYPVSAAVADLNRDGKLDLVVAACQNNQGSAVAIALGNGDGTFQAPVLYPALDPANVSLEAAMVAIGDLNGDGIPDIVTASGTILFGDGKGGVASRADYAPNFAGVSLGDSLPTGGGPALLGASVMLGDFDGDGKTDILFGTGNLTYLSGGASYPTLTVLFGAGGGVFTGAPVGGVPVNVGNFAYDGPLQPPLAALVSADFNGDGISDVASISLIQTSSNTGNVDFTVLLGKGNGLFSSKTTQTFPHTGIFFLRDAVAGDFNHDGKPDLAVLFSDYPSNGEIQIFLGRGDGTFGEPMVFTVPVENPLSIMQADMNGDGIPDLAVINQGDIVAYLGKGDGTLGSPIVTTSGVDNPAIAFGDFNGDGKLDIAAAGEGPFSTSVYVLLGKGDGTFPNVVSSALPSAAQGFSGQIAAADFDADGQLDLAVALGSGKGAAGAQQVAVLLGKGDGTFSAPHLSQTGMGQFAVADINGDKIPDLIGLVAPATAPPVSSGALSVRLGNGDGTFQPDSVILGDASRFVVADLNRDGLPDIAALYGGGVLSLLNYSQPAAPLTIVSAATFTTGPLAPGSIAAAFGEGILPEGQTASGAPPLPAMLSGVTVTVQDSTGASRAAPLYFVSPNQINFIVPPATAAGSATITVMGAQSGKPLTTQAQVTTVAPAIFTVGADIAAAYAAQVSLRGAQTIVPVFTGGSGSITAAAISLSQPGSVYLSLFGTGFDAANAASTVVTVQGVSVPVTYSGLQGTYAGLDQINLMLPPSLAGTGAASISIAIAGTTSNIVFVAIQ